MTALIRRRRAAGFTMLEVLVVVILIAILTAIVIPRLLGMGRRARESSLRGDLKQMRDAIQRFEGDCAAWPPTLEDLMVRSGDQISADQDGRGCTLDRNAFKGPYLTTGSGTLPEDPMTGAADWDYDNSTGTVRSRSTLTGINGIPYSEW